jgi:hypothetical protein
VAIGEYLWGSRRRWRRHGSRRRRVDLTQVERKKMIFSTVWVPPVGRIPKRYLGQTLNGLAKRAAQVGFSQVSSSLNFFQFQFFFFFFYFLF